MEKGHYIFALLAVTYSKVNFVGFSAKGEQDEPTERVHRAVTHHADQPPRPQCALLLHEAPLPRHHHQTVR